MKRFLAAFAVSASLSLLSAIPAQAQEAPKLAAQADGATMSGGCDSFTWDVSHELDVLGKPAKSVTGGTDGRKPVPLDLDQHYAVKLVPQGTVHFAAKPGKPMLDDGAQAGVFSFHTPKAGRYRVSITTGHWLDVVDGALIVVSSDFQGQRGCEKVHKIVQFELSGNKDFVLQLSGGTQGKLDIAITQVKTS
ncbi:MAG: hypothetical protein WDO68_01005 [Gammaproteobacteria bacterium]